MATKDLNFGFLKNQILVLMILLVLTSCSSLSGPNSPQDGSASQKTFVSDKIRMNSAIDKIQIEKAETELKKGYFKTAQELFKSFQENYPKSHYYQAARMGEAQSLEGFGEWVEAERIYHDIYLKNIQDQPQIAALAAYRKSVVYEALGNDLKSLVSAMDAKKMADFLPPEIAKVSLPARIASAYFHLEKDDEGLQFLTEADKGLNILLSVKPTIEIETLGRIYLEMGSVSTNQLSSDNYERIVEIQKSLQIYLLKVMQLNHPNLSQRALDQAKVTYQKLFNQFALNTSNREEEINLGGSLIDLISQAELFDPMKSSSSGQEANPFEKDFFAFIKVIKNETEKILYKFQETIPLSEASQKIHSVKRIVPKAAVDGGSVGMKTTPLKLQKKISTENHNL